MKIVTRKEFLALPSGVLYSDYRPAELTGLFIKRDSIGEIDFINQPLIGNVKCCDSGEYMTILDAAEEEGKSFELDFECASRDGCFEHHALYAIYEPQDIIGLIQTLQQTAQALYAQQTPTAGWKTGETR